MSARRVVFLDVDGVLHPVAGSAFFSPHCLQCLRSIVEATGADIVLSSMWQSHAAGITELGNELRRWGLAGCVDRTVPNGAAGIGEAHRAREIATWVRGHPAEVAGGWVALDDLDLLSVAAPPTFVGPVPQEHFVRTQAMVGLTPADAQRAIELLGGVDPQAPPLPPLPPPAAGMPSGGLARPRPSAHGAAHAYNVANPAPPTATPMEY